MSVNRIVSACVAVVLLVQTRGLRAEPAPSFNRDVRPILALSCFECHGPDENAREADLRLDTRAGATADLGGHQALKPGDPKSSELVRRITSNDPDEKMPPPDSGKSLNAEQIETLRRWISGGGAGRGRCGCRGPEAPYS